MNKKKYTKTYLIILHLCLAVFPLFNIVSKLKSHEYNFGYIFAIFLWLIIHLMTTYSIFKEKKLKTIFFFDLFFVFIFGVSLLRNLTIGTGKYFFIYLTGLLAATQSYDVKLPTMKKIENKKQWTVNLILLLIIFITITLLRRLL